MQLSNGPSASLLDLTGQTAMVTAAGQGLGRGIALRSIGSTAAYRPDDLMSAYNSAKAALVQFTRSVAVELAPHGILVDAVLPGPLRTTNTEWIYDDPKIAAIVQEKVPLGGPANTDDVASAMLYFAGKGAGHNTGSILVVDGGFLCT